MTVPSSRQLHGSSCRPRLRQGRRTSLAGPVPRAPAPRAPAASRWSRSCYNLGFFTLLAAGPFAHCRASASCRSAGFFFGWGLLLAFTSVVVAPRLQRAFGTLPTLLAMLLLFGLDLVVDGGLPPPARRPSPRRSSSRVRLLGGDQHPGHRGGVGAASVERPVIASAAYSFVSLHRRRRGPVRRAQAGRARRRAPPVLVRRDRGRRRRRHPRRQAPPPSGPCC